MIRTCPTTRRRPRRRRPARGFTLVELLVVIVILAILIALLLPAINGAMRTAKNARVGAEINQLAQALAAVQGKYGDLSAEPGLPGGERAISAAPARQHDLVPDHTAPGTSPTSSSRSGRVQAMRKMFPRVTFSTSGPVVRRQQLGLVRLQRQRQLRSRSVHPPGA